MNTKWVTFLLAMRIIAMIVAGMRLFNGDRDGAMFQIVIAILFGQCANDMENKP